MRSTERDALPGTLSSSKADRERYDGEIKMCTYDMCRCDRMDVKCVGVRSVCVRDTYRDDVGRCFVRFVGLRGVDLDIVMPDAQLPSLPRTLSRSVCYPISSLGKLSYFANLK